MITDALRAEADAALSSWGVTLADGAWALLDRYLCDVLEYNRKVNLTADEDAGVLVRRHLLDGLAALAPLRERLQGERPRIADVGSGAGFIGLSLKAAWPEARTTLIESDYRKFCFLNWTSVRLGLRDLRIVHRKAGKAPAPEPDGYDAVLARALAPLPEAVRTALPLARPEGWGLVYQSPAPDTEDGRLRNALSASGCALEETRPYRLPGEEKDRHLVILRRGR